MGTHSSRREIEGAVVWPPTSQADPHSVISRHGLCIHHQHLLLRPLLAVLDLEQVIGV